MTGLVLFGGEITADSVLARATATVDGDDRRRQLRRDDCRRTSQALGTPVGDQVPLADWGTLTLNVQASQRSNEAVPSYSGSVAALDIRLTADHGGLPAGSEIQIGYAEVLAALAAARAAEDRDAGATTTARRRRRRRPRRRPPRTRSPSSTPC